MKLKCLVKDNAGGVHMIVRDFDSFEAAYAELEHEGYRVYAINPSNDNEFRTVI